MAIRELGSDVITEYGYDSHMNILHLNAKVTGSLYNFIGSLAGSQFNIVYTGSRYLNGAPIGSVGYTSVANLGSNINNQVTYLADTVGSLWDATHDYNYYSPTIVSGSLTPYTANTNLLADDYNKFNEFAFYNNKNLLSMTSQIITIGSLTGSNWAPSIGSVYYGRSITGSSIDQSYSFADMLPNFGSLLGYTWNWYSGSPSLNLLWKDTGSGHYFAEFDPNTRKTTFYTRLYYNSFTIPTGSFGFTGGSANITQGSTRIDSLLMNGSVYVLSTATGTASQGGSEVGTFLQQKGYVFNSTGLYVYDTPPLQTSVQTSNSGLKSPIIEQLETTVGSGSSGSDISLYTMVAATLKDDSDAATGIIDFNSYVHRVGSPNITAVASITSNTVTINEVLVADDEIFRGGRVYNKFNYYNGSFNCYAQFIRTEDRDNNPYASNMYTMMFLSHPNGITGSNVTVAATAELGATGNRSTGVKLYPSIYRGQYQFMGGWVGHDDSDLNLGDYNVRLYSVNNENIFHTAVISLTSSSASADIPSFTPFISINHNTGSVDIINKKTTAASNDYTYYNAQTGSSIKSTTATEANQFYNFQNSTVDLDYMYIGSYNDIKQHAIKIVTGPGGQALMYDTAKSSYYDFGTLTFDNRSMITGIAREKKYESANQIKTGLVISSTNYNEGNMPSVKDNATSGDYSIGSYLTNGSIVATLRCYLLDNRYTLGNGSPYFYIVTGSRQTGSDFTIH